MTKRSDLSDWPTDNGEMPRAMRLMLDVAAQEDCRPEDVVRLSKRLAPMLGIGATGPEVTLPARSVGSAVPGWGVGFIKATFVAMAGAVVGAGFWLGTQSMSPDVPSVEELGHAPNLVLSADDIVLTPAADSPDPSLEMAMEREMERRRSPGTSRRNALSDVKPSRVRKDEANSATGLDPLPINDLEAEAALLRDSRSALESDAGRALRMTEQHLARFPRGVLGEEREILAIKALHKLGRGGVAQGRFQRFKRLFPNSPHISRLEELFGVTDPGGVD